MTGHIAEDTIRTVRERASLAEIVSEAVSLKRRGRNAVGLCPFHAEKTPSFTVSEERDFFHCFGCGEHGDVFAFVMKMQGLSFPEAVEQIAERVGVTIEVTRREGDRPKRGLLTDAHRVAAEFYRTAFQARSGESARAYLAERGISDESISRFAIGWAPQAGDALARHLKAQGFEPEIAVEAGLVVRGRHGPYDRFRGRVVFPITDPSGRVCAFGGRILPELAGGDDPPPKYMNSSESAIFQKGRVLYGLGLAREAIRRRGRVLVVEGYLDVIALAQAGIEEAVAPLGTALTADQLRVLRRFTDRVIACFDGDEAGERAAARSFPVFAEAGLWGHGVFLPEGDDPDSFVRTHGADAMEDALGKATPLVEAFVRSLAGPRRDAASRHADAAREVVRVLGRLADPLEREPLIRLAAHHLGVREETLRSLGTPEGAATPASERRGARALEAEELLVELLASDPALAESVGGGTVLAAIEEPALHAAAERLLGASHPAERTAVLDELPASLRDRVARRLLGEADDDEDRERMIADCVETIRRRRGRDQLRALRLQLHEAEIQGDESAIARAQQQLSEALTEKASR